MKKSIKINTTILLIILMSICSLIYSQNVTLYYDASIKSRGFSYNIVFSISQIKYNSTLQAGGWIVKLISITPDSKGYYSRGKTNRYYSCSELGSICNPNNFDKVVIGAKYSCKNNATKTITFNSINQEQKIIVNKEPNSTCSIELESPYVYGNWMDERKYQERIKELEYPEQSNNGNNTINTASASSTNSNTSHNQNNKNSKTTNSTNNNSKTEKKTNDSEYTYSNGNSNSQNNNTLNKHQPTKEEQDKKAAEEFMKKQAELEAAKEKRIKQQSEYFQNKVNAVTKSYYAGQAVQNAKDDIKSNSRLDGNYSSLEEMRADYTQKNQAIYYNTETLKQSQKEATQANYDLYFKDADEKGKAIGNIAVGITNIANDIKADEERKKAQQQLNEDRRKYEAKIKAEEEAQRLQLKQNFVNEFKDGGLPKSSSSINENEVYFFAYIYNANTLSSKTTTVLVSNVFTIAKYGDGTWPFKNTIINELSKNKVSPSNTVIIIGYYTAKEQAEEVRKTFLTIGKEIGFSFKDFFYKGKLPTNTATSKTDYWGNSVNNSTKSEDNTFAPGKIKTGMNMENPKSDIEYDYWGNPIKKNTQSTATSTTAAASGTNSNNQTNPPKIKTGENMENPKSKIEYDYWGNPIKK